MYLIWNANPFLDRAQELVEQAIDDHTNYDTAEFARSRPIQKGTARKRRLSEQVDVNMHTMFIIFVGKAQAKCSGIAEALAA